MFMFQDSAHAAKRIVCASLLSAFALTVASTPTLAAEPNDSAGSENGWRFSTAAYLWMANISGTQTVKGDEAELDVSFGDVLDVLDFAGEAHVEAVKDNRWGFYVDGTYLRLGPEAKNGPVHIRIDYEYWLLELGGVYRARTWSTDYGKANVDLLLGARHTSMDVDLDPQKLPLPTQTGSASWTDLIVGARLATDLRHNWKMILRGDIGGFGIGESSDLSAQGSLVFRWLFRPNWDLLVGYRALYQDYETGKGPFKFAYDATTHGPVLGLGYRF